jgi:hypothetical protein
MSLRRDHHVGGLQVAVDNPVFMGFFERFGDLLDDRGGVLRW